MLLSRPKTNSHLLPLLRYRDVGVASEWLCAVFGFQPHFAAKAPDGAVFYAELRLNESMVMLGSAGQYDPNALMPPPSEIAVDESLGCYIVVQDVDAHYRHAKASGAQIEFDLRSDAAGGRGYTCRDLEGHVWNFGTYNPWTLHSAKASKTKRRAPGKDRKGSGLGLAITLTLLLSVASGWIVYEHVRGPDNALSQHVRKVLRQAMRAVAPTDAWPERADRLARPGRDLSTGTISRDRLPSPAEKRELETVQTLRESLEKARKQVAALSASRDAEQLSGGQEMEHQRKAASAALEAAKKDAQAAQQALVRAQGEKKAAQAAAQQAAAAAERANALLKKEQVAKEAAEEKALRTQQNAGRRVAALKAQIQSQAAQLKVVEAGSRKVKPARRVAQTSAGAASPASDGVARTQLKEALVRAEEAEDKVQALQSQVQALKADKSALKKTVEKAEAELVEAKQEREAAMEALADAGAKIAELQVDLKAAKASAARANARAARARAQPTKKSPGNLPWPYSEW